MGSWLVQWPQSSTMPNFNQTLSEVSWRRSSWRRSRNMRHAFRLCRGHQQWRLSLSLLPFLLLLLFNLLCPLSPLFHLVPHVAPPPSRLPPASSPLPIPILLCGHLSHDLDLEQPDHHYYHNHHHLELEQLQLSAVRVAKLPNSTTIATAQSHGSARRCLEGGSWKNHGSPLFWIQNWNRLEKALKLSNELIFKCRWFSIEMFRWRT